ncbi:MAG: Ig-like domain-containing protein [Cyclobacteriaceae bacterium]
MSNHQQVRAFYGTKYVLLVILILCSLSKPQAQTADFITNPVTGCAIPHTVFFTDQSVIPDTWFWQFGDGNTSTLQNPVHNYTSTGSFTVSLTIVDTITGISDMHTDLVEVSVVNAEFTGAPLFGCGPLTTTFSDGSSINGPGTIESSAWNFGDGSTSTDQNPSHTYNDPGVYTVSLTVTSSTGCSNTRTRTNYVQVIGPDVDFQIDPGYTPETCLPQNIPFKDLTIFGAPIISYTWDFGDGGTSSDFGNTSHEYTTEGQFDVSLTVTDIDGCSRTLTKENLIDTRDQVAPSITCPGTQSETANALGEFAIPDYTGLATTSDDCDSGPTLTQSPLVGTIVNGGTTEISLTSTDASGNPASCSFDLVVTDNIVPTVTITTTADSPTNSSFTVFIVFSEAVQGFDAADIVVSNANKSDFTVDNALEYSVLITPVTDGTVTVDIPSATAIDLAGNDNTASKQISLTYDTTAPTLEITDAPGTANSTASFNITVQFDEAVEDFVEGDLLVTNGGKSDFQSVDSDTYTVDITPNGNGNMTLNVDAGVAADLATNPNIAASEVTIIYDDIAPSVTLTTLAANPTNVSFEVIIQFSEAVTGFTVDDLDITNGSEGALNTVNASEYRTTVTPSTDGEVTIELPADAAFDIADNGNTSATPLTITYDATPPTVAFDNVPATLNSTDPVTISIQFSEAIEEFILDDISLTNATGSSLNSTDQTNWTFQLTPTGAGDITMNIGIGVAQDPAGNTTSNADQANILFDNTPPTVSLSSTVDIATNSPFQLNIDFSEDVSGFELADIDPTNAALDDFSIVSASSYSVSVTPTNEGLVTVGISASVAQDIAANQNTAATPFTITYDITDPQVEFGGTLDIVNSTDEFSVSIVFSEEITAFVESDISITNGSVADLQSLDQITFTVGITPSGSGDITLRVPVSITQDLASNPNAASVEVVIIFDDEAPVFTSLADLSLPENGTEVVSVIAEDRLDITLSIDGGEDAARFTLDDATNDLSFAVAPDYESPQDQGADNTYVVIIKATDEAGNESTQEITVTITDRDENAPVITSATAFTLLEGETSVATLSGTDEGSFAFSIVGGADGDVFDLSPAGVLTFREAPDFEAPKDTNADNTYVINISAADVAGNSTSQVIRVIITDLDEIKPLYEGVTDFTIDENIAEVGTITFEDAAEVSYTVETTDGGELFSIGAASGALAFETAPDFEAPGDQTGTNNYRVTVTATDLVGNSSSVDLSIAVADVDENPPVFNATGTLRIDENQTAITTIAVADESEVTLSIVGGSDRDLVSLNAETAELQFVNTPDYEVPLDTDADNTYEVGIAAVDALGNTSTVMLEIAVADLDENAPVIQTENTINHPENVREVISIEVSDESAVTFAVAGGADASRFQIDATSGALSFVDTPDFENPVDANLDNVYDLAISVTDEPGNSASKSISVVVNDVLEPLAVEISAPDAIGEGDGQLVFLFTLPEPAPVDATLSYALSGTSSAEVDYTAPSGSISLARGASNVALTLDLIDDLLAEVPKTIVLSSVTSTYEGLVFSEELVEVTLIDNDRATLSLAVVNDGEEGVTNPAFVLSTSIAFETDTPIALDLDGSAIAGEDYVRFSTSVTMLAGKLLTQVNVELIDNTTFENDEQLEVSILTVPESTAQVGENGFITILILDDDEAPPLAVPTLFTPNNDGTNDQFIIRGGGEVAEISFTIMSREGHVVFESNNWDQLSTTGWDGATNGIDQPSDPYIWTVTAVNIHGEPLKVNGASSGIIQLLR